MKNQTEQNQGQSSNLSSFLPTGQNQQWNTIYQQPLNYNNTASYQQPLNNNNTAFYQQPLNYNNAAFYQQPLNYNNNNASNSNNDNYKIVHVPNQHQSSFSNNNTAFYQQPLNNNNASNSNNNNFSPNSFSTVVPVTVMMPMNIIPIMNNNNLYNQLELMQDYTDAINSGFKECFIDIINSDYVNTSHQQLWKEKAAGEKMFSYINTFTKDFNIMEKQVLLKFYDNLSQKSKNFLEQKLDKNEHPEIKTIIEKCRNDITDYANIVRVNNNCTNNYLFKNSVIKAYGTYQFKGLDILKVKTLNNNLKGNTNYFDILEKVAVHNFEENVSDSGWKNHTSNINNMSIFLKQCELDAEVYTQIGIDPVLLGSQIDQTEF